MHTFFANLRNRTVDVHPDELREMWFGFAFNFIVLASYYVIRPIRDDIGAAGGVELSPLLRTLCRSELLVHRPVAFFWGRRSGQDHNREIMTGDHCFDCTAGVGSICGGALA